MKKLTGDYMVEWWTHTAKDLGFLSSLFNWYKLENSHYHVVSYNKAKKTTSFYINGKLLLKQRRKVTIQDLIEMGVPVKGGDDE